MLCAISTASRSNLRQTTDLEIRYALRDEDADRIEKKQQEDHGP